LKERLKKSKVANESAGKYAKVEAELEKKSVLNDAINAKVISLEQSLSKAAAELFDCTKKYARKEKELEAIMKQKEEEKYDAIRITEEKLCEFQKLNEKLKTDGNLLRIKAEDVNKLLTEKTLYVEDLERQIKLTKDVNVRNQESKIISELKINHLKELQVVQEENKKLQVDLSQQSEFTEKVQSDLICSIKEGDQMRGTNVILKKLIGEVQGHNK